MLPAGRAEVAEVAVAAASAQTAGSSGGGSFGVYLWNSTVTINGGSVNPGPGGAGRAGAAGPGRRRRRGRPGAPRTDGHQPRRHPLRPAAAPQAAPAVRAATAVPAAAAPVGRASASSSARGLLAEHALRRITNGAAGAGGSSPAGGAKQRTNRNRLADPPMSRAIENLIATYAELDRRRRALTVLVRLERPFDQSSAPRSARERRRTLCRCRAQVRRGGRAVSRRPTVRLHN